MVTKRTLEKYVTEAEVIAEEINETPELVTKVLRQIEVRIENGRRQPKPPAPEGGICVRKAAEKYGISRTTVSRWARKGLIKIMQRTDNWLYLNERSLQTYLDQRNN